jgi:hypothetical protein
MSYSYLMTQDMPFIWRCREDVDHLFCYCPFSNCIWYDLYSKCLIPFRHPSWVSTISRLSFSGRGSSIKSLIIRLMLAIVVYYIWRKKNVRLHDEASRNNSIVYSNIVHYIVSKVNLLHNMASSDANRQLNIL